MKQTTQPGASPGKATGSRWSEALGHAFAELPDANLVDKGDEFSAR